MKEDEWISRIQSGDETVDRCRGDFLGVFHKGDFVHRTGEKGREVTAMGARYRDILGYLPQDFGYYPNYTAEEFLLYIAALKGIPRKIARKRTRELLEIVDLSRAASKKMKTFSGGMKQRVGIAQALLNHLKVLILDEPTAGLDPKERVRLRNLLADYAGDKIVIFSTHIVSDVEAIADQVLMMKDGRFNRAAADPEGQGKCEMELLQMEHKKLWRKAIVRVCVLVCFIYMVLFGSVLSFQWFSLGSSTDIFRTNTFSVLGRCLWSPYLLISVPVLLGILCVPFAIKNWSRRLTV